MFTVGAPTLHSSLDLFFTSGDFTLKSKEKLAISLTTTFLF